MIHKPVLLCLLLCTIMMMLPVSRLHAETDLSAEYLAGIAFFKFAKVEPDFKPWVLNSQAYKSKSPHDRALMMKNDVPYLQNNFSAHVIEDNPITIKLKASFTAPNAATIKKMMAETGKIIIPVNLVDHKTPFFPLQVGDMWIALIAKDLEQTLNLTFNPEDYDVFLKHTAAAGLKGKPGTLILTLVPIKADTKAPIEFEGFSMWMLMADIVGFELWSADEKQMAWYMNIQGQDKYIRSNEIYNLFEK